MDSSPPISSWASKVSPFGPKVSTAPKASEISDRDPHPDPDPGQQVAAVGLDQVGDQDADDERGLKAFAQANQEVGEHVSFIPGLVRAWRRLTKVSLP